MPSVSKISSFQLSFAHLQHKKGVIHRDLKAENVFFVSDTQIKVGDFGFSTQSKGNMLDTFCGSPPYAAPELFQDNSYQGELVDIWAMGVMLYYMVSGIMPFQGETIPQLKAKILNGKFTMPGGLTPVCQDLISGLLTNNPDERFVMDDIFGSMWLRTGSTCIELHPSKRNLKHKTSSKINLPKISRDSGVVDTYAAGSTSALGASFSAEAETTPDREVLLSMEMLGVPYSDESLLIGEPRNPIAGTYRILLHRKHLSELTEKNREGSDPITVQKRKKKISDCSSGGQSFSSNSSQLVSGGSARKRKSSKENGQSSSKPMSKVCAIL